MRHFSDEELLQSVDQLAVRGFQHERNVIEHLLEVERRDLHLKLALPSLFEFARKRFNAAERTVYRWLRVAQAAKEEPRVLDYLSDGRLNLTALATVLPAL